MLAMFGELLKTGPKLVLFEDAHWADPSTRDIMNAFAKAAAGLKVLCVFTTRPNPETVKTPYPGMVQLELEPLDNADA